MLIEPLFLNLHYKLPLKAEQQNSALGAGLAMV
jgi:hypothetical protein